MHLSQQVLWESCPDSPQRSDANVLGWEKRRGTADPSLAEQTAFQYCTETRDIIPQASYPGSPHSP